MMCGRECHVTDIARVGIIEWMKNTKPLKEFVMDALREDEVDNYKSATMYHKKWLTSKYKNSYQEMYRYVCRWVSESVQCVCIL